MITLKDLKDMQDALQTVLEGSSFLGEALSGIFRQRTFSPEERSWIRHTMYDFVQLKNRYRMIVEHFTREVGGKEDLDSDIRLWLIIRRVEQRYAGPLDDQALRPLWEKSRVKKLRRFLSANPIPTLFQKPKQDDQAFLWEYHSHPLWVLRKWLGNYPLTEVTELCKYNNSPPDSILRINPIRHTREEVAEALRAEGIPTQPTPYSPFGLQAGGKFDPMVHKAFRKGDFALQSLSSQLVCLYVNPKPGERLLDFCAGEGGKTLTLSHLMKGRGEIHAHDKKPWKLTSLQGRLRREGACNVRLEGMGAIRKLGPTFDSVLLDVPCTGSGNFQRQPELKWRLTEKDLHELNLVQLNILDEASPFCKPGGFLFYVTCSLFNEENHKVVRRFLNSRKGWELVPPSQYLAARHASGFWVQPEEFKPFVDDRYFQVLPQKHHMPGMFCAVLRRDGKNKEESLAE